MSERDPVVIVERSSGPGLGAFVVGALLGAGAALLLAPKTGRETQEELKQQVQKWKGVAEERMKDAQRAVEDGIDQAREGVSDRFDQVRDAVDAGRKAAHEARDDLEYKLEQSKAAYRAGVDAARGAVREPGETPAIES